MEDGCFYRELFVAGAVLPVPKLRLRDQSLLNDLKLLAEAEIKTLCTGSSSRSGASSDSTGTQNLTLAMAVMNQRGTSSGLDVGVGHFPLSGSFATGFRK